MFFKNLWCNKSLTTLSSLLFSCHCILDYTSEKTDSRLFDKYNHQEMVVRSFLTVPVIKNFYGFLKNCYWKNDWGKCSNFSFCTRWVSLPAEIHINIKCARLHVTIMKGKVTSQSGCVVLSPLLVNQQYHKSSMICCYIWPLMVKSRSFRVWIKGFVNHKWLWFPKTKSI